MSFSAMQKKGRCIMGFKGARPHAMGIMPFAGLGAEPQAHFFFGMTYI